MQIHEQKNAGHGAADARGDHWMVSIRPTGFFPDASYKVISYILRIGDPAFSKVMR
jgi:hypothetical protein